MVAWTLGKVSSRPSNLWYHGDGHSLRLIVNHLCCGNDKLSVAMQQQHLSTLSSFSMVWKLTWPQSSLIRRRMRPCSQASKCHLPSPVQSRCREHDGPWLRLERESHSSEQLLHLPYSRFKPLLESFFCPECHVGTVPAACVSKKISAVLDSSQSAQYTLTKTYSAIV